MTIVNAQVDKRDSPPQLLEHSGSSSFLAEPPNVNVQIPPSSDCESLLEQTVDNCVVCVDNIDAQHTYEQVLQKVDSHQLSADEAAQIRLNVMEDAVANSDSLFPDMQDLNICGTDDLEDAKASLKQSVPSSSTTQVVHHANCSATTRPSSPPTLTCAICLETVDSFQHTSVTFCHLPCCGSNGREARSSTKVCTACMLLLSSPTSSSDDSRIGRCPRCRSWLVIRHAGLTIEQVENAGQCHVCNQVKEHLVDDNHKVCDACFLGRTSPLFYECKECHYPQRIPHPMYRYQQSVDEYGTTSWACQGPCQNFTKWRILPDQVAHIPAGEAPEEWGNDYLETARLRVLEARRNMRELNNTDTGCIVQ